MERDHQKSRLYAWEDRIVAPHGGALIPFERAQAVVDALWLAAGLQYPPRVEALPKNTRRKWATGSRQQVRLHEGRLTPTWVIIHEVAHSMASDFEGDTDGHGPDYVWLYMQMIERHLKIPLPLLMYTARESNVRFNVGAKPRFTDAKA